MVGSNCSIYGCSKSANKTKGLGIFQIPTNDDEYSKNRHKALVKIITEDRVVYNQLREQMLKRSLYICKLHYKEDQINRKFFIFNSDNHYC